MNHVVISGDVTYSIIGGNTNSAFNIDGDTGKIYTQKTLDRETTATYDLEIRAEDNGMVHDVKTSVCLYHCKMLTVKATAFVGNSELISTVTLCIRQIYLM